MRASNKSSVKCEVCQTPSFTQRTRTEFIHQFLHSPPQPHWLESWQQALSRGQAFLKTSPIEAFIKNSCPRQHIRELVPCVNDVLIGDAMRNSRIKVCQVLVAPVLSGSHGYPQSIKRVLDTPRRCDDVS